MLIGKNILVCRSKLIQIPIQNNNNRGIHVGLLILLHTNIERADQPVHPRNLTRIIIIRCLGTCKYRRKNIKILDSF